MLPIKLLPGAIRGINTENSVIRGSKVTLKDKKTPFGSVSTSMIPSRPGRSRTRDPFVGLSPGEKKRWGLINYFSYVFDGVFDHGWCEFQLKYWRLCFFFCKTQVPDLWYHQDCHISGSNHWTVREKSPSIQFHVLSCN